MAEKIYDKYYVFKREDLEDLCELEPLVDDALMYFARRYDAYIKSHGKRESSYIVCNQDEPYAEEVWNVILRGEEAKE